MCRKCGAYSEERTRDLTRICRPPDRHDKVKIKRFFVKNVHPASTKKRIAPPKLATRGSSAKDWDDRANEALRIRGKTATAISRPPANQKMDCLQATKMVIDKWASRCRNGKRDEVNVGIPEPDLISAVTLWLDECPS